MGEGKIWDGQISIEHQLDIHVGDLVQLGPRGLEVPEILGGLRYVMDYRIRGRRRGLHSAVCDRLARALLLLTGELEKRRRFFASEQIPTTTADVAFILLADFSVEVEQFLIALAKIPAADLKPRLRLGVRILKPKDPPTYKAAVNLLKLLVGPEGVDWRDLFYESELNAIWDTLDFTRFFSKDFVSQTSLVKSVELFPPPALYFDRQVQRVFEMFRTSEESGLTHEAAELLRAHYGENFCPPPTERPWWIMLLVQFADMMIVILIITTIVSAVVDFPHFESALVLGLVVVLNVAVGFWQDLKSSRTIAAMRSLQVTTAHVRRDGKDQQIPSSSLVPGDLVIVSEGDYIPADLRLVRTNRLQIRETILTGESFDVEKNTKPISVSTRKLPLSKCAGNAFMGTTVARGTGIGIAVRTGANTEIGRIGAALNSSPEVKTSCLGRKLHVLAKILVAAAIFLCTVVAITGITMGEQAIEMIRLSLSLAVSVIPEGLVAILTVSMALAVRRLARKSALVRRLNAIEILGSTSVIAADKTGTLTKGNMRMQQVWCLGGKSTAASEQNTALEVCLFCNNASLSGVGEATELALLHGVHEKLGEIDPAITNRKRISEVPFDSERRMMSVVTQDDQGSCAVYSKGAVEAIISKCSKAMAGSTAEPLTGTHLEQISAVENENSSLGLRVLALATRTSISEKVREEILALSTDGTNDTDGDANLCKLIETDLIFVGLVFLIDPPRAGVAESVAQCQMAGITVCMITGDHLRTATSIATRVGIYDPASPEKSRVIKGRDLDMLSIEALASLTPFPSVFARVSPQNKLSIVQALQMRGACVAMTGDGVNDAPAIRQADVGIAMGRGGTQITRDAASMILLNDDFSVIVHAIAQGRQMYHNVTLFLVYLLSCNSAEIWTVMVAMFFGWPAPLSPINILWANLIADIPPSMCLGVEKTPESILMSMKPTEVTEKVMGISTWFLIAVNGATLSAFTLTFYGVESSLTIIERRSQAFLMLIGLQLVLALVSRSDRESLFSIGLFGNFWLVGGILFSFAMLVAGLYMPILYNLLDLRPVGWTAWAKLCIAALVMIGINEMAKLGIRKIKILN